jgi:hypothetical protein
MTVSLHLSLQIPNLPLKLLHLGLNRLDLPVVIGMMVGVLCSHDFLLENFARGC